MTGPFDSIIGMKKEIALQKFITMLPTKFTVAENDLRINGVIVSIDKETGNATSIERINETVFNTI